MPPSSWVASWKCLKKYWLNELYNYLLSEITDLGTFSLNELLLLSTLMTQLKLWVPEEAWESYTYWNSFIASKEFWLYQNLPLFGSFGGVL